MDHCSKLWAKLLDLLLLNLWEMFVFTQVASYAKSESGSSANKIDSASVNIHSTCIRTVQLSVSACTVGRDPREHSPHLCVRVFFALSHCSKGILKVCQ